MTASLSISNARAVEGDSRFDPRVLDFDLELSGIAPTDVAFDIVTLSGTADRSEDFVARAGRITIPQGETQTTVTVEIIEDTLAEADENFFLEVRDISGAILAGNAPYLSAEGLIETDDGDTRPVVLVGDPRVVEGGTAVFEVTLSRPFGAEVSIPYRTVGITATPGEDFTETTGSLAIAAGDTTATVTVPLLPDSAIEPSERFDLVLDLSALETAGAPEGAVGEAVILDDDAGGGVLPVLTVSDARGPEGDSRFEPRNIQFTAELSAPAATDSSFVVVPQPGTADAAVDFVGGPFTVTFPAGTTHRSFTIDMIEDEILEPDESFRLELRDPDGLVFEGGAPTVHATGVIEDEDSDIRPSLFVSDPQLVEGAAGTREAVFEITLSRAFTTETQIPFQTIAGSAEAGADFVPASGIVTFLPGQRAASVAVGVVSDTAVEDTERFDLRLDVSGLDLASGVAGTVGTATILDDDASGGLTPVLSILDARQTEGDSRFDPRVVEFTIALSTAAPSEISFAVETLAGSATEDVDFEGVSTRVTVEAGQTAVTVPVNIIEDTLIEGDESFRVKLSDPEGASFAGGGPTLSAQGLIAGDDSDVRRALLVRDLEVVEGDTPGRRVVAEVELSRPADTPVTVAYSTAPRGGTSADDIGGATGVLTFAPGQTRASIELTVEGDTVPEPTEQVDIILSAPQGAAFSEGANGTRATLTILDDDASDLLPVISLSDARQVEGDSRFEPRSFAFEVSLDRPAPADITFDAMTDSATAAEGTDFDALDRQVTIAAGQTTQTILVTSIEDEDVEPDETFTLALSNPTGGVFAGGAATLEATGTILNDDGGDPLLPALRVENISVTEPASGTATATFTIASPVPAGLLIQGQYEIRSGSAEAGADFTAEAGSFQILPGTVQTTVSTEILSDGVAEGPESFVLELSDLVNAGTGSQTERLFAIGTIEDPQPPVISIEPPMLERTEGALGGSVFGFRITRSGDESVPVFVDLAVEGTGANPADMDDFSSLPGSIFLDAGVTEVTPTIAVRGDTEVEPDETFRVTISNPTNGALLGNATAIGTILDDDGNAAPTAVTDIVAVAAGTTTTLDLAANDTDPDDDPLAVAEAGAASGPGGAPRDGTVSASGGTARYTPDFGFEGTDSFLYTVTDGSGATDLGRAFVTVGDPGPTIREDGVLRGTDRADVMTLAQNAIYLGNEGPDTYLVSEAAVEDRVMVFEDDADTVVQLVEGLLIVESLVVGEAIQLTLANNARVQILGAPEMTFDVGGNATTGTTGTLQDYDSFVADTLGAVPDGGVLAGGPLIVGEDLDLLA